MSTLTALVIAVASATRRRCLNGCISRETPRPESTNAIIAPNHKSYQRRVDESHLTVFIRYSAVCVICVFFVLAMLRFAR